MRRSWTECQNFSICNRSASNCFVGESALFSRERDEMSADMNRYRPVCEIGASDSTQLQPAKVRVTSNATPIFRSDRHTARHESRSCAVGMVRLNSCGMPVGLGTSRLAPQSDKFRTTQLKAPPGNSIRAPLKTRRRYAARFSMMALSLRAKILEIVKNWRRLRLHLFPRKAASDLG